MIKGKSILALGLVAALAAATANAAVVNLGTDGSGSINGALFDVNRDRPTGTGVYNPFLTIQATGNQDDQEGFNSSTGNFDTKREPQWNHEIRFSDLQQTTINGIAYFGFSVDVNEPNGANKATISLDRLLVYTSPTIYNDPNPPQQNGMFSGSLGTLRYDLDAGGDNSVLYNDQQSGSGSGDIDIFIPVSLFAGTGQNDYVYMYQMWGASDAESEGGFEETRLIAGITPIPELSSFFPIIGLMVAVFATNVLRRRKMAQQTTTA